MPAAAPDQARPQAHASELKRIRREAQARTNEIQPSVDEAIWRDEMPWRPGLHDYFVSHFRLIGLVSINPGDARRVALHSG